MPAGSQEAERQEVLAFVTHILEDTFGIDPGEEMDPNTLIGPEGLGLESIGILEVTVHLEREYGIEFSDETLDVLIHGTLGEFIDEILKQRTAVAAGSGAENSGSL